MAKKKPLKSLEFKTVSFRLPAERYELLAKVAKERAVDLTAVLNGIVADVEIDLQFWLRRRAGLLAEETARAARVGMSEALSEPDARVALGACSFVSLLPADRRAEEVLPAVRRFRAETKGVTLAEEELVRWVRAMLAAAEAASEGKKP